LQHFTNKLDVRGSVHHSTIHKEKRKIQQDETMNQNFIIPYLYEAEHVSAVSDVLLRLVHLSSCCPVEDFQTFCASL